MPNKKTAEMETPNDKSLREMKEMLETLSKGMIALEKDKTCIDSMTGPGTKNFTLPQTGSVTGPASRNFASPPVSIINFDSLSATLVLSASTLQPLPTGSFFVQYSNDRGQAFEATHGERDDVVNWYTDSASLFTVSGSAPIATATVTANYPSIRTYSNPHLTAKWARVVYQTVSAFSSGSIRFDLTVK